MFTLRMTRASELNSRLARKVITVATVCCYTKTNQGGVSYIYENLISSYRSVLGTVSSGHIVQQCISTVYNNHYDFCDETLT